MNKSELIEQNDDMLPEYHFDYGKAPSNRFVDGIEAKQTNYITSVERIGIEKGRQQGVREGLLSGIELGLELKFGDAGLRLLPEIHKIEDVDVLRAVHAGIRRAADIEELRLIYQPA
jgi:hypothetical protein